MKKCDIKVAGIYFPYLMLVQTSNEIIRGSLILLTKSILSSLINLYNSFFEYSFL